MFSMQSFPSPDVVMSGKHVFRKFTPLGIVSQKHLYLIGSETDFSIVQAGYHCGCRRLAFPQLCMSHSNLSTLFV